MQHYWVYMLRCSDGSYYTGHTDNLEVRLWQHEQGVAADWTRRRRPVTLVWSMAGGTRDEVFAMERQIKNWSRAKKEALIAGDWALVGHFALPPSERPELRPSTSLGTSGDLSGKDSLVPSEVEGRSSHP
ncbi:MAG: GIY-YIG nuclease family protein [Proteobacteria bacterium]|nr:GIY-YIG nuclease family protein [Pseudomonadota bacterium]